MSTPPFLETPETAAAYTLRTARGPFAVVDVPAEPDARPGGTAVLVPGFTGSKEDYIAVLAPLAAAGHRVVAIDQRGQFETPGPDDVAAYAVEEMAADLQAVIDAVGDGAVHLVGHSFGGLVTRAVVLADSDAARSLTLMSSGPAAVSGEPAERLRLLEPVVRTQGLTGLWEAMQALARADGTAVNHPPHIAEFLHRRFHANSAACLLAIAAALTSEPDRVDALAATHTPTLVTHGPDDDVWTPAEQQEMADRLGAQYAPVAGAGHSPAAEAPRSTARLLEGFWAACEDGSRLRESRA